MLGAEAYPKLLELVDAGDLIPLETVAMTRRDGFGSAVKQARDRFKDFPETFEWIFDIVLARANDVTPLPCVAR